ncbi:hypothetical protein PYR77_18350 (plasmid) [Acinetobacter soli]|nr:hypothetical protein [Acinetobacter soli]WEH90909.1 hypothetical protein PYR75_00910 [Acinetobacter soli]WEI02264.1 hypothetical protein PYR77_18350 [Acinetobacter soli]
MIFKAIAHWWASSNLEKEEARTKSLIRELDRENEAVKQRLQVKKMTIWRGFNLIRKREIKSLKNILSL